PGPSNTFHAGGLRTAFEHLRAKRTVNGEAPGPGDVPFCSLTAGSSEGGPQDTLLRCQDPGAPGRLPVLAVARQPHPYQTFGLLPKVFNQATVRSNVFAVWLTVGFFEVTEDQARPVKLGAEVGRAEGRHVRHRMFAVVDRSVLTANPGPQARFDP